MKPLVREDHETIPGVKREKPLIRASMPLSTRPTLSLGFVPLFQVEEMA